MLVVCKHDRDIRPDVRLWHCRTLATSMQIALQLAQNTFHKRSFIGISLAWLMVVLGPSFWGRMQDPVGGARHAGRFGVTAGKSPPTVVDRDP